MNATIELDTRTAKAAKSKQMLIMEDNQLLFVWRAFITVKPVGRVGLSEGGKPKNFATIVAATYAKAKAAEWRSMMLEGKETQ